VGVQVPLSAPLLEAPIKRRERRNRRTAMLTVHAYGCASYPALAPLTPLTQHSWTPFIWFLYFFRPVIFLTGFFVFCILHSAFRIPHSAFCFFCFFGYCFWRERVDSSGIFTLGAESIMKFR
jgi:hypothetical protein